MSKGKGTHDAIVDEALAQATVIGLEGLSLGPLADRLNLSKSGLFAHFKSKEALQIMVVEEAIARFQRQVTEPAARAGTPRSRLVEAFDRYIRWIVGSGPGGGCLFLTSIQEYDERPGPIRDRLVASQREWREFLCDLVSAGVSKGEFRPDADPEQVAFELIGIALSFQHSNKLLRQEDALERANAARDRVLERLDRP